MTCVDKLLTWRTALAYIHVRVFRVLRVIFNSMHIGHTYTTYASGISEEVPIRPGLGIYQLSKGCGSEICRVFSENYHITVITALFFGFVGAWGDAVHFRIHFHIHKLVWPSLQLQCARSHVHGGQGNLPFTVTFRDAAQLVRKCVEVDLQSLPANFNTFFCTAPQPQGQYVSDKARRYATIRFPQSSH